MAFGTYTYVRISPTTTTGSTSDTTTGVVPSPPEDSALTTGIILEFTPVVVGYDITFPDVEAVRGEGNVLLGFNTPGNRNSGGGGEVRKFPPGTTNFTASNGVLIPCTVDYLDGFGPGNVQENPSGKIRWVIKPVNPAVPGIALWQPEQIIAVDMTKVYVTATVQYE